MKKAQTAEDGAEKINTYQTSRAAKKEATRKRILAAARKVFVAHPFKSASLRTIGEEAGVKHPLIIHYFGSKTALFERIAKDLEGEILVSFPQIFNEIKSHSPAGDFKCFLSLLLKHSFGNPDPFKAIMLNMGETDTLEIALPGLGRMGEVRRKLLDVLGKEVFHGAPQEEVDRFLFVFILSISNYIGASQFHAKALGLSHNSPAYAEWVGDMFEFLFPPAMEAITNENLPPVSSLIQECSKKESLAETLYLWKTEAVELAKSQRSNKAEATKAAILVAARSVFSQTPYDSASIRTIARQGKFDHTLIHHYFPTKADLLECVAKDLFEEFMRAVKAWSFNLEGRPFPQVLTIYLDRALDYCFKNSEALGLLMHNLAQEEHFVDLEGFEYVSRLHTEIYDLVLSLLPVDAPDREKRMWLYTLIMVLYSMVGAPEYPARLLGLNPNSEAYRQWVLRTLISVFLPVFYERD